ncbi:hypothetical protein BH23ACT6_BH23ACT6_22370 [soil metagenome]
MREWIPVSTSSKGRLALAAVRQFGTRGFDEVTVSELAASAEVTTGALYHHFQNKLGLYTFVRRDVERRLLDRMEGAAEAAPDDRLGTALAVGFNYAVRQDFTRMLSEPPPYAEDDLLVDLLGRLSQPVRPPIGNMLTSAWRAALSGVADGNSSTDALRAIESLTVRASTP